MNNTSNESNRTLTIKKVLNAPVESVWEAWTKSEHIIQWWTPPGMPVNIKEHDFRPGGKWKFTMTMPNGQEFVSEGTYIEIVPYKKIISSADFKPMTENVELHIKFETDGDKTNFEFSVVHETEEYAKAQEKMGFYNGWGSALERMAMVIDHYK